MKGIPMVVRFAALIAVLAITAGATLWLNPFVGTRPVSAQAACNFMGGPFDTVGIYSYLGATVRMDIRDSGEDHHAVWTVTDPSSGNLLQRAEMIIKGGTLYFRNSAPLDPNVYDEWEIHQTNVTNESALPCVDTDGFQQGAAGTSDEAHFTTAWFVSEEHGEVVKEFWVDSSGRPTRARQTHYRPQVTGAAGASDAQNVVVDFTYSGFGEPNVITAPVMATPTPEPTATATATPTPTPAPPADPTAVQDLSISSTGLVSWRPPLNVSELRNYRLRVQDCSRSRSYSVYRGTGSLSWQIPQFSSENRYRVEVYAVYRNTGGGPTTTEYLGTPLCRL